MNKNYFIELLKETDMFMYGFTKGTMIMTPRSTFIWELIKKNLDKEFKKINIKNVQMPALIPLKYFKKEKENFEGFEPELITITEIGKKKLKKEEHIVLRPTSEVFFSYYFKKKLNSYRDLPILLNQWSNVWRWENNTNPFLRTTEFFWNEGHTLHETKEKALFFCKKMLAIYKKFIVKKLLIPIIEGEKSTIEKFAGASKTWALETILPDGQFLQLSTVHLLSDGFIKMFDINFLNKENKFETPFQTSWAISTRLIAGLLSKHFDDEGLILPPFIADIQILIIKINKKKEKNIIIEEYCDDLFKKLKRKKIRVEFVDNSNKSFGYLNKEYRKKGIPLQIEVGLKEVEGKTVTFQLRTELKKEKILLNDFIKNLNFYFKKIKNHLFINSKKEMLNFRKVIKSYKEYKKIKIKDKIYITFFCGTKECEKKIKEETNTTSRILNKIKDTKKCFRCDKKTNFKAIFGRSY